MSSKSALLSGMESSRMGDTGAAGAGAGEGLRVGGGGGGAGWQGGGSDGNGQCSGKPRLLALLSLAAVAHRFLLCSGALFKWLRECSHCGACRPTSRLRWRYAA